jgi:uncharacterized damage-inducible protein DinB
MKGPDMDTHAHSEGAKNDRRQIPGMVVAARDVLEQGLRLLELVDEKYPVMASVPFESSIGRHYRHVLEHFQCLLQGVASGEVNYDSRQRNPRIEQESAYAGAVTREVLAQLECWTENTLQQRCTTISTVAYHVDVPAAISSNLARELVYCIGHAIHHYAIIRLLCSHLGVPVSSEFGYAPSTLKFQSRVAAD